MVKTVYPLATAHGTQTSLDFTILGNQMRKGLTSSWVHRIRYIRADDIINLANIMTHVGLNSGSGTRLQFSEL